MATVDVGQIIVHVTRVVDTVIDTLVNVITYLYTVNHKKRDILFLTITLANLNRFLHFVYNFNREEILHANNKIYHITRFMCAPYLEKSKPTFLPWLLKRSSVHVTATLSNLNRFQ